MMMISQGAEGKIFRVQYLDKDAVCKTRVNKKYRIAFLDQKINKSRILQESRCLAKCKKFGIPAPTLYLVDPINYMIYMEYIDGESLKNYIYKLPDYNHETPELKCILTRLGEEIARLHDCNIVHGDLTTSNIMLRRREGSSIEVVLIDFGLGLMKPNPEDKAVDLYVLERAFVSTHPNSEFMVEIIIQSYTQTSTQSKTVMGKLEQVRARGRKRDMLG